MLGHNGYGASVMWLVLGAGRTSEPRMNPVATPTAADSGYPGGTPCLASHVIDYVIIYILVIVILLLPIPAAGLLCPLLAPTAEQLPLPAPWARVGVG